LHPQRQKRKRPAGSPLCCPMLAFVRRPEVNVCRLDCAAGEFEFVAGEFEPLSSDLLPVRGFVAVAFHFLGSPRVLLTLVFRAVALAGWRLHCLRTNVIAPWDRLMTTSAAWTRPRARYSNALDSW